MLPWVCMSCLCSWVGESFVCLCVWSMFRIFYNQLQRVGSPWIHERDGWFYNLHNAQTQIVLHLFYHFHQVPLYWHDNVFFEYASRCQDATFKGVPIAGTRCSNLTDEGVSQLAGLSTIESLNLRGCLQITDTGLQALARMSSLRELNLQGCKLVTARGVRELARLSSLEVSQI